MSLTMLQKKNLKYYEDSLCVAPKPWRVRISFSRMPQDDTPSQEYICYASYKLQQHERLWLCEVVMHVPLFHFIISQGSTAHYHILYNTLSCFTKANPRRRIPI